MIKYEALKLDNDIIVVEWLEGQRSGNIVTKFNGDDGEVAAHQLADCMNMEVEQEIFAEFG